MKNVHYLDTLIYSEVEVEGVPLNIGALASFYQLFPLQISVFVQGGRSLASQIAFHCVLTFVFLLQTNMFFSGMTECFA